MNFTNTTGNMSVNGVMVFNSYMVYTDPYMTNRNVRIHFSTLGAANNNVFNDYYN